MSDINVSLFGGVTYSAFGIDEGSKLNELKKTLPAKKFANYDWDYDTRLLANFNGVLSGSNFDGSLKNIDRMVLYKTIGNSPTLHKVCELDGNGSNIVEDFAIVIPVFRLFLLNEDESIKTDISDDLISASLSIQCQQGQRRTMNIQLINADRKYVPKPITGLIWIGSKFRFDSGVAVGDTVYWLRQGVFVFKDPTMSRESSKQTISLSLCDKFGLLDGSVRGNTSLRTIIPQGVSMCQAFNSLLKMDKGNGIPYDIKPILFNIKYKDTPTYYTIKKDADTSIGELLNSMGQTISSDIYYNAYGNLCVQSNVNEFVTANYPVIYKLNEGDGDIISAEFTYNFSQMYNKIIIKGAIVNGYQFSGIAENRNMKSDYCIQYNGVIPKTTENTKLYSDDLCMERAMYDLINYTRGCKTLKMECSFLPHLDVNQSILVNYPSLGIKYENYPESAELIEKTQQNNLHAEFNRVAHQYQGNK